MTEKLDVKCTVNGEPVVFQVEPRMTLADAVREELGLTGTHLGCEQGSCGACTILVDGQAVRSCLMFAFQAEGREVETVECLSPDGYLDPLQRSFLSHRAFQCGFCTPGFLMSLRAVTEPIGRATLVEYLSSNICRCTGYEPIVAAAEETLRHRGLFLEEEGAA